MGFRTEIGQDRTFTQCCAFTEAGIRDTQAPHAGNGDRGKMKIIAAIEDPAVIAKILTHLGLPARAPPRSPARPLALFRAA